MFTNSAELGGVQNGNSDCIYGGRFLVSYGKVNLFIVCIFSHTAARQARKRRNNGEILILIEDDSRIASSFQFIAGIAVGFLLLS